MNTTKALIDSNQELEKLANEAIEIIAEYAFYNPNSINGPFGTLKLSLSSKDAVGTIKISTLWEMGSTTVLHFNTENQFNPSTGYTSISGNAKGTISVVPNPPKSISASIEIMLQPGLKEGTLSVSGFFNEFQIKATSIHHLNNN